MIEKIIQEMLDQGIVQYSSSSYASLVELVGKKDGSWRLWVDHKALNKVTIKDKFPIPLIEELLDELRGSQVYFKIDLRAGYHQIRMTTTDVQKTAFKTHSGHYEYLVMSFGLTNALSKFPDVFREHLRKFILVFFDGILVFSKNLEKGVEHPRITLDLLVHHQLFAKESVCLRQRKWNTWVTISQLKSGYKP